MGVLASMMGTDRWNSPNNPAVWSPVGVGGATTTAGETVTPDGALQLSAYFRCIANLSEDVGKLPMILYEVLDRGKRRATKHPLYRLLHTTPNRTQTAINFREMLIAAAAGWGDGYAEIERDRTGEPIALWPVHPSRVDIVGDSRNRVYRVRNDDGKYVAVTADDMIHIEGQGKRAIQIKAESLGVSLAAQKFAAAYYGNGMGISMAIIHPGKLSPEAHARMRESWSAMHQGAGRAHKPFIGEENLRVEKISIPANEAQFLETRVFQIEEICRWFRMPPHKIQHLQRAAGWSTLESANTDYLTDTLLPWFVRVEQEFERKLLRPDEQGQYDIEFLYEGLLRGDSAARASFYTAMFNLGAMSSNDIRERENLNPREGGDTYLTPGNLMTDAQREKASQPDATTNTGNGDASGAGVDMSQIKAKADAYGVAVRAGAITPTPDDEAAFREAMGLPAITNEAVDAWRKDNNVRRPITITPPPGEKTQVAGPAPEPENDDESAERSARVMVPVVAAAVSRVITKEVKAVKHAATKHKADAGAFNKWADGFYTTHAKDFLDIATPVMDASSLMPGGWACTDAVQSFIASHIETSRNAIDDAFAMGTIDAMCAEWTTTRTGSTVDQLSAILFPKESQ